MPELSLDHQIAAILSDTIYAALESSGVEGRYSQDRIRCKLNEHIIVAERTWPELADCLRRLEIHKSNQDMAAFVDRTQGHKKVYFAYRGTSSFIRDVCFNDLPILIGDVGGLRPYTALKFYKSVVNNLGNGYHSIHTGHSLGGSVAEFVATLSKTHAVSFNTGGTLLSYKVLPQMAFNPNIVQHCVAWDWISMTRTLGQNVVVHHCNSWSLLKKHSIENFLQYKTKQNQNLTSPGGIDLSGAKVKPIKHGPLPVSEIIGAVFLSESNLPMLIGQNKSNQESLVTVDDFAVALILAYCGLDAAFSLDPWVPTNPDGPWLKCNYYPQQSTQLPFDFSKTRFGQTLFEADWLLKQLSMGVDVKTLSLAQAPMPLPLPLQNLPLKLKQLGMKSQFEYSDTQGNRNRYSRLWITIDRNISLQGTSTDQNNNCTNNSSSIGLQFTDVKMHVRLMRQTRDADGCLTDLIDPAKSEPNASDVQFAKFMTAHYNEVAEYFPCLRRLRELSKLSAIAKWLVGNNVAIDIDSVLQALKIDASSVQKVPALERTQSSDNYTQRIFGGVDLRIFLNKETLFESLNSNALIVQMITEIQDGLKKSTNQCELDIAHLKSNRSAICLPFIIRKCCYTCGIPISYPSMFPPPSHSSEHTYCEYHHPDTCEGCKLPVFINPKTLKPYLNESYQFRLLPNNRVPLGSENQTLCKFHPSCLRCADCEKELTNSDKIVPDIWLANTYYHQSCSSPLSNIHTNLTDDKNIQMFDEYSNQIQMEWALKESTENMKLNNNRHKDAGLWLELEQMRHLQDVEDDDTLQAIVSSLEEAGSCNENNRQNSAEFSDVLSTSSFKPLNDEKNILKENYNSDQNLQAAIEASLQTWKVTDNCNTEEDTEIQLALEISLQEQIEKESTSFTCPICHLLFHTLADLNQHLDQETCN